MKKILLSTIYFLACILSGSAQSLYETTLVGGVNNGGTIVKFPIGTGNVSIAYSFDGPGGLNGTSPNSGLIQAKDGKLYGTTNKGGTSDAGVIYSFDPSTSTYLKVKDFDIINGADSRSGLMQASDGKLYGMTNGGGSFTFGVIYSFDPSTSIYTKIKDLNDPEGFGPFGSLIQAKDGKLYGLTKDGGSGGGVMFSLDLSNLSYVKLLAFSAVTMGSSPYGSLIQASNGKLYGMTVNGGINGLYKGDPGPGVIFSYDPSTAVFTKLVDMDDNIGSFPYGNLTEAKNGKLYGLASGGGNYGDGTIFSLDPLTNSFTKIREIYINPGDGVSPSGTLLQASDGNLYGTSNAGGQNYYGINFYLNPTTNEFVKLYDYEITDAYPTGGSAFVEVQECVKKTYYFDADGDGYGNPDSSVTACTQPAGYVLNNQDCNDSAASIHAPVTYYRDADRDGFGDVNQSITVCKANPPRGYVKNNYDCDDHRRAWISLLEKVRMCHNGRCECVYLFEVWKYLHKGWTLGPCSGVTSKSITGEFESTELQNQDKGIKQYKISNYPNPFAGKSTIKYELPEDSKVSIKVYDNVGRLIATLVDANKKAGSYTVDFNAGHSTNKGAFYYRIIAISKEKQFSQTNMMIHLQ